MRSFPRRHQLDEPITLKQALGGLFFCLVGLGAILAVVAW